MNSPATTRWYDSSPHPDGAREREFLLTCLRSDADAPVDTATLADLLALCTAGEPQETGPAELALWIDLFTAALNSAVAASTTAALSFALDLLLRRRRAGVRARRGAPDQPRQTCPRRA